MLLSPHPCGARPPTYDRGAGEAPVSHVGERGSHDGSRLTTCRDDGYGLGPDFRRGDGKEKGPDP